MHLAVLEMFLPQNRVCGGMFRALDCHLTPSELGDRSIWSWGCWLTTDHLSTNCQPPDMTSKSEPILDRFFTVWLWMYRSQSSVNIFASGQKHSKILFPKKSILAKRLTELRERCEQSNKVKSTICFWLRLLSSVLSLWNEVPKRDKCAARFQSGLPY